LHAPPSSPWCKKTRIKWNKEEDVCSNSGNTSRRKRQKKMGMLQYPMTRGAAAWESHSGREKEKKGAQREYGLSCHKHGLGFGFMVAGWLAG
jgi:hypothetical protein